VERHGHAVGDALEHRGVGGDRRLNEVSDTMTLRLEALDPRRIDELRVEREVEFHFDI